MRKLIPIIPTKYLFSLVRVMAKLPHTSLTAIAITFLVIQFYRIKITFPVTCFVLIPAVLAIE